MYLSLYIYIYKTEAFEVPTIFHISTTFIFKKKKNQTLKTIKPKKKNVILITRYSRCSKKLILLRKKSLFLISLTLPSSSPKTQNSNNLSSHIWTSQLILPPNLRSDHLLQTFWIRIRLRSSKSKTHRHGLPYLLCL